MIEDFFIGALIVIGIGILVFLGMYVPIEFMANPSPNKTIRKFEKVYVGLVVATYFVILSTALGASL